MNNAEITPEQLNYIKDYSPEAYREWQQKQQDDIKNVFRMNLNPIPFKLIESGKKTVEMRLFDERRRNIFQGDLIIFTNTETGKELVVEVQRLRRFSSFVQLYNSYPKTRLGYNEEEEANPNDMLQYYSQELIDKYGVLAIEIQLLK